MHIYIYTPRACIYIHPMHAYIYTPCMPIYTPHACIYIHPMYEYTYNPRMNIHTLPAYIYIYVYIHPINAYIYTPCVQADLSASGDVRRLHFVLSLAWCVVEAQKLFCFFSPYFFSIWCLLVRLRRQRGRQGSNEQRRRQERQEDVDKEFIQFTRGGGEKGSPLHACAVGTPACS